MALFVYPELICAGYGKHGGLVTCFGVDAVSAKEGCVMDSMILE